MVGVAPADAEGDTWLLELAAAGVGHATVVRSRADLTREKVQADQRLDLELPALQFRKQVGASGDEPANRFAVHHENGRAVVAQHARRCAGDDEASRAEPCREVPRKRIGVDVEQASVDADADAGDDRQKSVS